MTLEANPDIPDILICHISDLHIKNEASVALERIPLIAGAIGSQITRPTNVIIAVSGDIAFSGKADEYALAAQALERLLVSLESWDTSSKFLLVSPGNHDCDFDAIPSVVQSALIKDIQEGSTQIVSISTELVRTQVDFNLFRDVVCTSSRKVNELLSVVELDLQGRKILVHLVNSAWTSRVHEVPGSLRMPLGSLPEIVEDADLSIAIVHHPLNWYAPGDARHFSEWLDTHVDMALWGHEHMLDDVEQTRIRLASKVQHLLAMPIEDPDVVCGFTCVKFDAPSGSMEKVSFEWHEEGKLNLVHSSGSISCPLNPARFLGKIRFSKAQLEFLDDTGALLKHPQLSRHLKLSEILVAPEIRHLNSDKVEAERLTASMGVHELVDAAVANKKSIVIGPEQSGKTTFAKLLISELRSRGMAPIYLDTVELKSANRGEIKGWLNSAIATQYESDCIDDLMQLSPDARFAVVDNLQSAPAGATGVTRIFELLSAFASGVLSLTSDSPAISVISANYEDEEDSAYWIGSSLYELLPLGHKRRGELIRKWIAIGRTDQLSPEAIEHEARQVKAVIDATMGKNFLPRYPIFVLVLLQQLEVGKELKTVISNGSQGFLFDALITKAFESFVRRHSQNTVRDFLAGMAAQIWNSEHSRLSSDSIHALHEELTAKLVTIDLPVLMRELTDARIILSDGRGFGFRYPYLYYFFLALWISKQEVTERVQSIDRLVEFVHTEQSANVLIFLAHLERQQEVLSALLPVAETLYKGVPEGTLADFSKLSLRFRTAEEKQVLLVGRPDQVSDHINAERDGSERALLKRDDEAAKAQLEEVLKFNTATKSIQVLGQVLRSRASGISRDEKLRIARASMGLTRRMMSVVYGVIYDCADVFVLYASDAFENAFKVDKQDAIEIANSFIGLLVVGFGQVAIGKVADALASPELPLLIKELEAENPDQDSRLMFLMARLIGDSEYPSQAVVDLNDELRPANILARSVLSWAVARRFHMDPPEHSIRDQACASLGIEMKRLPYRSSQGRMGRSAGLR